MTKLELSGFQINYWVQKCMFYYKYKACCNRAGVYTSAKVQAFLDLLLMTYSTRADSILDTTEIENLH